MDQQESHHAPRPRSRKRSGFKTALAVFLCLIVAGGLLFWYLKYPSFSPESLLTGTSPTSTSKISENTRKSQVVSTAPNQHSANDTPSSVTIEKQQGDQETPENSKNESQIGGGCEKECSRIESFYAHLDEQAYVKAFKLSSSSREHFKNLIVKLAQNPPVITRETDDLFTLLRNTAHFFRILGKHNVQLIKGILDQEKGSIEEILADFYAISKDKDCLKNRMGIEIPDKALYNYAGFFLNTMGGRLYLFRRDSFSRLPVSYYSILIIDEANRQGTNNDGIDIRPAISALIGEIENTGNRLKLKETYLDVLYELKEKYPLESAD